MGVLLAKREIKIRPYSPDPKGGVGIKEEGKKKKKFRKRKTFMRQGERSQRQSEWRKVMKTS